MGGLPIVDTDPRLELPSVAYGSGSTTRPGKAGTLTDPTLTEAAVSLRERNTAHPVRPLYSVILRIDASS